MPFANQLGLCGSQHEAEAAVVNAHIHIANQIFHDFAEGQRHNGQIVAPETQHGNADDKADDTGQQSAEDHGKNQPQHRAGHGVLEERCQNHAGKRAHTHETCVSQAQFTAHTHQQVQGDGQHDIAAHGNQIAGDGAAQLALIAQGLHDDKGDNHHQIGGNILIIVLFQQCLFHIVTLHFLLHALAQQTCGLDQQNDNQNAEHNGIGELGGQKCLCKGFDDTQ